MDLESRDRWCPHPPHSSESCPATVLSATQDEGGTSLHSRRGKPEAPKGSPQINRKSGQEMATVMQSGRPRSSSTTDAPTSSAVMEIACAAAAAAACLPGDEAAVERVSLLAFLFLLCSLYLGFFKLFVGN